MAENQTTESLRADLEKQIETLKNEISDLRRTLTARGEELYDDLRDEAEDVYEGVSRRARGAARVVSRQTHAVTDAIRENPGTAATVLSSAGLFGFLIGLAVGHLIGTESRR